jgi:mannosyltransferase OCH1-like enzyme
MIPRRLIRTVPEHTTTNVEAYWQFAIDLHPEWQHRTFRDPIDPDLFPHTSALWPHCTSGAQRAGLIRLEALWSMGGVYIDSDVELYRPLDSLLGASIFACYEDANVVPDAVLGAHPGHRLVLTMLDMACASVERGEGPWASGPGVTTAVLTAEQHQREVLLLPPGSFYPYHYTVKERERVLDHHALQPWAFGAHHWHHSWAGQ